MGYRLIWEPRGVLVEFFEHVSPAELLDSVQAVNADPRFDGIAYRLNDFLRVVSYDVTDQDRQMVAAISWAASLAKTLGRGRPVGLVASVTVDPRIAGELQAYHQLKTAPTYPYCIVPTLEEARAWIGSQMADVGSGGTQTRR